MHSRRASPNTGPFFTGRRALVYTYDSRTDVLVVELAVVDGQLRP